MLRRQTSPLTGSRQVLQLLKQLGLDYERKQHDGDYTLYDPLRGRKRGCAQSFWLRHEADLPYILKEAHDRYRELMKKVHPDVGGDQKVAASVNMAYQRIEHLFRKKGVVL